ncbi:MAG: InlB B-repeat-containing protein [Brevefilum fermentans]|jgi:predicted outer membrane repeat protein|uniref:Bacterial repeat domain-containing protein n=1 Tax=Candidatus Brevifilum fermentans TaxID=1986204 RepID=A0A1Y6K272_9CHLR|nr:choice-of-anchor Q domain-containing protein [Brevefilum fermentans]SMX53656.1 exported protein of unknown function [Brevefilum fermentans]HOM67507.1 choice-of-anchor Q domain-containing protein [Brevefilum fermentans]
MKRINLLLVCLVVMLLAFPVIKPNVSAQGTHIFVSPTGAGTDCSQAAPCKAATGLSKADDGDTLYFKYGTYKGTMGDDPIFMVTEAVSFIGGWDGSEAFPYTIDPMKYKTIIDGENEHQLMQIDTSSTEVIHISGITFKNGDTVSLAAGSIGGAILVKDGGVFIDSCRFENNHATTYGGALYVISDDPFEVRNSQFIGNMAFGSGAIYLLRSGTPPLALIEHNQFIGNTASAHGSVIEVIFSAATINANLIANNTGPSAIEVTSWHDVKITNNFIYWNTMGSTNFSAIKNTMVNTEVINNTIVNAKTGINAGSANMTITNNIFSGCYESIIAAGEDNLTGTNNLFYNNAKDDFPLDNPITGQDPLFVNAAMQNYHLKKGSPAIDAGAVVALTDDFDGDERPMGDGYDIGADEFDPDKLDLTVIIKPDGAGEVQADPPRPYHKGNNVTLTAVPNAGWVFRNWEVEVEGDTAYKVFDSEMEITMTDNTTVTAQFVKEYQLTVRVDPDEAGSIDIDHPGPYYADQEVMLTAVPNAGWSFSHWSGNASGDENPLEVTITGDTKVTAHFKRDSFEIFLPLIRR